ncbi:hypothetical protein LCGC14_2595480, partial [marine sediment metagenome]
RLHLLALRHLGFQGALLGGVDGIGDRRLAFAFDPLDGAKINAPHPLAVVGKGDVDGLDLPLSRGLLIERGADMNVKDSNGTTPLQMAVYNGRAEAVKLLIERGADINAKNNKGETALDIARRRNKRVIAGIIQEAIDRDLRTQQEAKDRRLELAQQEEDDRAFKVAGSADTIDAWSAYLKTNPSSQHRKDALKGSVLSNPLAPLRYLRQELRENVCCLMLGHIITSED